ncbi:FkbM family methyltransferase [Baekduia soli]|uniref:FkbM family methyltransferase n=1 Tax=Baekduia soli TaxID=496014 RepID=UPI0016525136|nr:FkbM family methyltransferase [Baekduia soli]
MPKDLSEAARVGVRLALDIGSRNPLRRAALLVAPLLVGSGLRRGPLRVRLRLAGGERDFVVPDLAGFLVLWEVFSEGAYADGLPAGARTIVDLGANSGASVLFLAGRYPGARIVAVEAGPAVFGVLEANVGGLPGVRCVHGAVTSTGEPVTFHDAGESWGGWTHAPGSADDPAPAGPAQVVAPVDLDALIAEAGPVDLLKIDVEGAEFDVLPACAGLDAVGTIVGEIHAAAGDPRTVALLEVVGRGRRVTITSPPGRYTTFVAGPSAGDDGGQRPRVGE